MRKGKRLLASFVIILTTISCSEKYMKPTTNPCVFNAKKCGFDCPEMFVPGKWADHEQNFIGISYDDFRNQQLYINELEAQAKTCK